MSFVERLYSLQTQFSQLSRKLPVFFLLAALILNHLPVAAQQNSSQNGTPSSEYTYGECRGLDRERLRSEIETHAKDALDSPLKPVDVDGLVARKWAELNVDATIDGEVAKAVEQVRQDEGYWSRLWSGWSPDKADEFARRIISDTFGSPVFAAKLDELSTAIGTEIARDVQSEFARAASAAFLCLQQYVGERYSTTLFNAFEEGVRLQSQQLDLSQAANVDVDALDVHSKALTGVGLIVVTEIARRVAIRLSEKIAERVAGKIIGRVLGKAGTSLIPVAGWVIGIGLVVWDLWEGGQGALPQIQESLTSEDVKVKIRSEITTVIKDGLPQESAIAAVEISATLIDEWDGFCTNNRYLCLVADENPGMRSLLEYVPVGDLAKLSTWVDRLLAVSGRSELDAAIDNGQMEALMTLPLEATTILSDTRSLTTTLAWGKTAGDRLPAVVNYGIHRQKSPADFDPESLALLLAIDDAAAISRLTSLQSDQMQTLLKLPAQSVTVLAKSYTTADLQNLADVLAQPQATPVAILADQVVKGETTIVQLQTLSATHQLSNTAASVSATNPVTNSVTSAISASISTMADAVNQTVLSWRSSIYSFFAGLSWLQLAGLLAISVGLLAVAIALWLSRRD